MLWRVSVSYDFSIFYRFFTQPTSFVWLNIVSLHRSYIVLVPPSFVPKLSSHGNSNDKRPFFPTWPSTRNLIRSKCLEQGPKDVIESISFLVGGVTQAQGPGQLPRSERQVTNMRKSEKVKGRSQGNAAADDLFVVMQRAHTEDPSAQFIRGIKLLQILLLFWLLIYRST